MKKKLIIALFAFVSMFMFTGCIDFLEEITYHRNGTGTYQFSVDMSAMKTMLGGLGGGSNSEEAAQKDPSAGIKESFDDLEKKLKNVPGISHFTTINDTSKFVFGFSFDFQDLAALDKAMHEQTEKIDAATHLFSGKKRLFKRFNKGGMADLLKKDLAGGEEDENMEMVKSMFGDMKIKTVYHFDRKVKSSSNPNSLISSDKKTVTLNYYFFKPELNKGDEGIGTTVKLRWW